MTKEIQLEATYTVILEIRRPKADDSFPLCLRVTYLRARKYYRLKISLTIEQYERIISKKLKGANPEVIFLKEVADKIDEAKAKAKKIIAELKSRFTFSKFESEYKKKEGRTQNNDSIVRAYNDFVERLTSNKQITTSLNFECAMRSLGLFVSDGDKDKAISKLSRLQFQDITPDWLSKYEGWMLENGKSYSTISIYLRTLRQLYLEAIEKETVSRSSYPFGKDNKHYKIPRSVNFKRALEKSEIKRLLSYDAAPASGEEFARDIWTFSYLCNGANLKDIARLRYQNIDFNKSEVSFIRAKTEHKREKKNLVADVTPLVLEIINRHGNKDKAPGNFVFPILRPGITPRQELFLLRDKIKFINFHLKKIATNLKFSESVNLTTMTARHSHATVLRDAGVPVSFISESMGHSNVSVTENYLGSFDHKKRAKNILHLTDFEE